MFKNKLFIYSIGAFLVLGCSPQEESKDDADPEDASPPSEEASPAGPDAAAKPDSAKPAAGGAEAQPPAGEHSIYSEFENTDLSILLLHYKGVYYSLLTKQCVQLSSAQFVDLSVGFLNGRSPGNYNPLCRSKEKATTSSWWGMEYIASKINNFINDPCEPGSYIVTSERSMEADAAARENCVKLDQLSVHHRL